VLRPNSRHTARLFELFGPGLPGEPGVSGITLDSRLVNPGDLYVALPGRLHHGAAFAAQAAAAGAAAILTDEEGGALAAGAGLPVVVVADPRHSMAYAAAMIYGRPAEAMTMLAVTGTNGKTTTTFLLEAALRSAGVRTGLVGTIGFRFDGEPVDSVRTTVTTPESTELQGLLGYLLEQGAQAVLMEVSSHALVLGRADAITFDVSAFTNLGRDHLDFHGDEDSYFEAKAALFTPARSRHAVLNIDDPRGRELADRVARQGELGLTTISLHELKTGAADAQVLGHEPSPDGRTAVRARLGDRTVEFSLSLPGDFNIRNALTALAMVSAIGGDLDLAAAGLARAEVPGRMQRVDLGAGTPIVYVDFAHTPQAVTAALQAVGGRRIIAVLGCGGDRDPNKRGPMGEAASRSAEVVIVTDDNPRSEDPAAIRSEILAGATAAVRHGHLDTVVVDGGDRRSAIRQALTLAAPGDVVAILGKGHEVGQEVAGTVLPFSDAAVATEEWRALHPELDGAPV
jgi:UDP-N-acetylmuramoyl-L-alanyl-D-glutamate--2,6-diaminopimelate ligase